jgi:hypothetical protein
MNRCDSYGETSLTMVAIGVAKEGLRLGQPVRNATPVLASFVRSCAQTDISCLFRPTVLMRCINSCCDVGRIRLHIIVLCVLHIVS